MEFKFGLNNDQIALSHFMLEDGDACEKIAAARAGCGDKTSEFIATVFINGVQIDAGVIEKELHRWYNSLETKIRNEFAPEGFEKRVEDEVQKRIKERADGIIELLDSLRDKLQASDDLIKPYWER